MTGNDKLRFAKEITKGVMCLHKMGIIHRDLVKIQFPGEEFYFRKALIIVKIQLEFFKHPSSRWSNKNCGFRTI